MDRRCDDLVSSRLEEILTKGAVFISWNELYLWYDVKKIAAGTYRDLATRWDEIADKWKERTGEKLGNLMFVQSPLRPSSGLFLFAANMPQEVYEG